MPMHRHDTAQLSVLLSGLQREVNCQGETDTAHFAMQLRPPEFEHATLFGDQGAILLSINLFDEEQLSATRQAMRQQSAEQVRQEWHALIAVVTGGRRIQERVVNELTDDLLAAICEAPAFTAKPKAAPHWLHRARGMLIETELDSSAIAGAVGVHRVHLARSFRRYFGLSLTRYRVRMRLARATQQLVTEKGHIAETAVGAGFSDQSHLTRHMRREMGLTPAALMRVMNATGS